jgi:hypothetical protein
MSVWAVRAAFVAVFVVLTVAPGTRPPEESRTVPTIPPRVIWASATPTVARTAIASHEVIVILRIE